MVTKTSSDLQNNKKSFISLCTNNLEQRELTYTIQNDHFKVKAYQQALQKLSLLEESEGEINEKMIKNCNFGKNMQEKILFMFNNKKDLPDNELISERDIAISNLMKIQNIGLKKAITLFDENNIVSIEMLKENQHLINSKQCTGLKYHDHIQKRIPHAEIDLHYNIFNSIKEKVTFNFVFDVVGSYRRNVSTSGDIDILMYINDHEHKIIDKKAYLKEIVETMQNEGYVPDDGVFALGEKKFMGMCKLKISDTYRRLDILITTKEEYPFSILYFTGSKSFNILMREQANKLGLILNEKAFAQYNKKTKDKSYYETIKNKTIKNEQDIFEILNIKYTEPENRYFSKFVLMD